MNCYYGFDLGDAESVVARLKADGQKVPEILPIGGQNCIVTAYALTASNELIIGENACLEQSAIKRKLRFKSRFLTDHSTDADVRSFAAGVLNGLEAPDLNTAADDTCFYVGCPAGWGKNDRERYRSSFEAAGYPPVKIISESRAALVSACQSRHLQVGYNILSKPTLVVDIGSSTTDFAYVCNGKEVDIRTAGEVRLGGGIMDEILLDESVRATLMPERIRRIFAESEPWKNYCSFAARRLKEKYYSDEAYWQEHRCTRPILIRYNLPVRLTLTMDKEMADKLLNKKVDTLDGKSFKEVFLTSLRNVRDQISGPQPELLFLTGGVSKIPVMRDFCAEVFPDAVVICGAEPEYSVARGLAWCGRIDEDVKGFREELEELKRSTAVEDVVSSRISDLYRRSADALVEPIVRETAVPVFEQWRSGKLRTLSDASKELETSIEDLLRSDRMRELLASPVEGWLHTVAEGLEQYTTPICLRHNVPYEALSLQSGLDASEIDIRVDAKSVFGVQETALLIDSVVSVIVALLCGGSGIALVASGVQGLLIGFLASFLVLIIGKKPMENAIMSLDIPGPMRKLVPKNFFEARIDRITAKVREKLYRSLETDRNAEISARLTKEISAQIEQCLTEMAEVVEIPLG